MTLHVGVAGAGIGGLVLAQALRARGARVTVFERDGSAAETAGYRLHLDAPAMAALRRVLPARLVEALRASGVGAEAFTRFAVLDSRGRTRLRLPVDDEGEVLLIGRRALREVLAGGLDGAVRWGDAVTDHSEHPDGVTVRTAGGAEVDVDVLVGADGAGSRTTRRLTGRPAARPAGVTAVAGTVPLDRPAPPFPRTLERGLAFAIGPGGAGVFLAAHLPGPRVAVPGAVPEPPYLVWSVALPDQRWPEELPAASGAELGAIAEAALTGWSPRFRDLVAAAEPGSVAEFPFVLPADPAPWRSDRVTLLGDAVHPVPPTAGAGASTAVADAAGLAEDLLSRPLPEAMAAAQERVLAVAPAVLREALPVLAWQRRLSSPVLRALATGLALPAVGGALALGRRLRGAPLP
ncbi:FAD-dependent oxidoreductase [Geodermatophilus maliterrae]|uniref:FAD-dependent oxidoreductase n=1 Tax=Geodermatophilus maliterrae TaxID=3162531 RepID=A0ABV3XGI9_9ACTN